MFLRGLRSEALVYVGTRQTCLFHPFHLNPSFLACHGTRNTIFATPYFESELSAPNRRFGSQGVSRHSTVSECLIQIARIEFATPIFCRKGFPSFLSHQNFGFAIGFAANSDRNAFNPDRNECHNRQKRGAKIEKLPAANFGCHH